MPAREATVDSIMDEGKREREYEREARELDRQITNLEGQLDAARRRVGELADDIEDPGPELEHGKLALLRAGHDGSTAFWLGAPMLLRLRRRFDGRLPQNCFHHMLDQFREHAHDAGIVEELPESLVWSSSPGKHPVQPHWMIRLVVAEAVIPRTPTPERHDCFTTLTVTDRLDALAGRLFGAFGGILGAGGLAAPVAASLAFPMLTPVFVVGWLGGVYGVSRSLFRKIARGRAKHMQKLFTLLIEELEPHIQ
jgi:hypothetical protein